MNKKSQSPRVLLLSGIFYPDIGGPATHVRKIAERLHGLGWHVTVVAFGNGAHQEPYRVVRISKRVPKPLSWALYVWQIIRAAFAHDVIYAFDLTTAGLPAAVITRLLRKPFLLRIGGDPIWERVVEQGKRFIPMAAYYEQSLFLEDRPILYRLIRFVVRSADHVVTYNTMLEDLYVTYFGLSPNRLTIVANPVPTRSNSKQEEETFTFIFAGRFVSYKNLERLVRVFERLHTKRPHARLLLVGDGPEEQRLRTQVVHNGAPVIFEPKMAQKELHERLASSSVALAPALTEFNPNFILEALSMGKPSIISEGNGLSVAIPKEYTFDPMDDESLFAALERVSEPQTYQRAVEFVQNIPAAQSWERVLEAHCDLIQKAFERNL